MLPLLANSGRGLVAHDEAGMQGSRWPIMVNQNVLAAGNHEQPRREENGPPAATTYSRGSAVHRRRICAATYAGTSRHAMPMFKGVPRGDSRVQVRPWDLSQCEDEGDPCCAGCDCVCQERELDVAAREPLAIIPDPTRAATTKAGPQTQPRRACIESIQPYETRSHTKSIGFLDYTDLTLRARMNGEATTASPRAPILKPSLWPVLWAG
jgi:hypothetical protein